MLHWIARHARRAVKLVTHPVRAYFNSHFEMTKAEIRSATAAGTTGGYVSRHVDELANVVAETSVYQARLLASLRDEVEQLRDEVAQLRTTVDGVRRVVAASLDEAPVAEGADGRARA